MVEDIVVCPKCGTEIPVTKALKDSIESRVVQEYDKKLEAEVGERLVKEREKLMEEINQEFLAKNDELNEKIRVKEKHLQEARERESEERRKRLEMEENLREQKLVFERRMEEERGKMLEDLRREYDEEFNLKTREIRQNNESLMKQVQELKQKLEQGSQQLQGEAFEIEIEETLRSAFPSDIIEPVPPGTKGPDVIQTVRTTTGFRSGAIAWEAKRTKEWNDEWVVKLKGDLLRFNAEIGVIVSKTLPKDIKTFGVREGIVVTGFESIFPLAVLLRTNILEIARQRRLGESSTETKDILYSYLTSAQFRQRVEAITEGITRMRNDVYAEKRAMEKQWAKRIKELEKAVTGISGMYGDLQGIVGPSLQNVKALTLPEEEDKD
jgi:hypothetical protein